MNITRALGEDDTRRWGVRYCSDESAMRSALKLRNAISFDRERESARAHQVSNHYDDAIFDPATDQVFFFLLFFSFGKLIVLGEAAF